MSEQCTHAYSDWKASFAARCKNIVPLGLRVSRPRKLCICFGCRSLLHQMYQLIRQKSCTLPIFTAAAGVSVLKGRKWCLHHTKGPERHWGIVAIRRRKLCLRRSDIFSEAQTQTCVECIVVNLLYNKSTTNQTSGN